MALLSYFEADRVARDESLSWAERAAPIKALIESHEDGKEWDGMSDEEIVKEWLA